jgi:hypothetical protein
MNTVELSSAAEALARKDNIKLPTDLRVLHLKKFRDIPLTVLFSPHHVFAKAHMDYLAKEGHSMSGMFLSLYESKRTEPLWFRAYATCHSRAIVRRKAASYAMRALIMALSRGGYDIHGRRLEQPDATDIGHLQADLPGELYGSIVLSIRDAPGFLKQELSDLVGYFSELLPTMLQGHRKLDQSLNQRSSPRQSFRAGHRQGQRHA